MSRLMRTSEVSKLPVVTFAGYDVAQVKDVVYAADGGAVAGFTLAGRGLLAGPLKQGVLWRDVHALGADAVMIRDEEVLSPVKEVIEAASSSDAAGHSGGGRVLGSRVLTDSGVDLGEVVDVVIEFGRPGPGSHSGASAGPCDVVGYEITASESLAARRSNAARGTKLLVPLPDQLAVSGEHLMVPAAAESFVSDDLAGFGASVEEFRSQLRSAKAAPEPGSPAPGTPGSSLAAPAAAEPASPVEETSVVATPVEEPPLDAPLVEAFREELRAERTAPEPPLTEGPSVAEGPPLAEPPVDEPPVADVARPHGSGPQQTGPTP